MTKRIDIEERAWYSAKRILKYGKYQMTTAQAFAEFSAHLEAWCAYQRALEDSWKRVPIRNQ